ncbi:hypothetical protein [Maritalea sp.]|uniref:hypothetical protein n=1 Tax=Maritalea sp. TaxID=2003361 RepID=UPI003EF21CE2
MTKIDYKVEDDESLQARVETQLSAIDLSTDIDQATKSAIEFGELSGTAMSDYGKKLLILVERKVITSDECARLMIAAVGN